MKTRSKSNLKPRVQFMYRPLAPNEFRRRMEDSFSPVYLTSISIIQGAALALLCQQTFTLDLQGKWLTLLYIFMSFTCIVGISFEYNWFVGLHRWSLKFLDTIIPFALGFWEIGAVLHLLQPQLWWLLTSIFSLCGAIAFWNTYVNLREVMFTNQKLFTYFRLNMWKNVVIAFAGAVICFLTSYWYTELRISLAWYFVDLPAFIIYMSLFGTMLLKEIKFLEAVHEQLCLDG